MTSDRNLHLFSSTISAKLVATSLYGSNIFLIFWMLTLTLLWKRGKLSKTLSGNFMWSCARSASFFRLSIPLNLEQVCDNVDYVSVEFLEDFTAFSNIISVTSLSRLVIASFSIFSPISICIFAKLRRSTFSVSCDTQLLFHLTPSIASKGEHCIWF